MSCRYPMIFLLHGKKIKSQQYIFAFYLYVLSIYVRKKTFTIFCRNGDSISSLHPAGGDFRRQFYLLRAFQ